MDAQAWSQFLNGAIALGFLVSGLFFFRFWSRTKDRLFVIFGLAFWVMTFERVLLLVVSPANEFRPYVYLVRLFAFLLIIIAIIDKNRGAK